MSNLNERHDSHVDERLTRAALACTEDIGALRPMFDALALAPSSVALMEDLRTRLHAALGPDVAAALVDGAADVQEVARRGERAIQLRAMSDVISVSSRIDSASTSR